MLWQRLWTICLHNFCSAFLWLERVELTLHCSHSPAGRGSGCGLGSVSQIHLIKIWEREGKQRPSSASFGVVRLGSRIV